MAEHRANYFELEEDEAEVDIGGSFGPVYDESSSSECFSEVVKSYVGLPRSTGTYDRRGGADRDAAATSATSCLCASTERSQTSASLVPFPSITLLKSHPQKFILHFHQSILNNNIAEINAAYESGWNKLTEKYFAKTEWPDSELIAPLVDDDQIFLTLYRELYYRCGTLFLLPSESEN